MKKLTFISALLIGCVLARLPSFVAFAGDIHQIYPNRPRRGEVFRFHEGDTVVYHKTNGETKTFNLGKFIDEGEHGRVFELLGTNPPDVIKFSKDDDSSFMKDEIRSFEILKAQNVPHSEVKDTDFNFYSVKKKIQGSTLDSLNENLSKFPRSERTEILKDLHVALQRLVQQLQKGPYGFDDLHTSNVMLQGHELTVIDPMNINNDPAKTAKDFESAVRKLSNIGPCLALIAEDPIWLERYYDLRESRGHSFLDSEKPEAIALRNSILSGQAVPAAIQEQVIISAVREPFSPQFGDKIKPLLKNILKRGEMEGPLVHALMNLLLDSVETPAELVELAKIYSMKLSYKTRPTAFFFRKLVARGSWDDIQNVFRQVPSEFKPLLIRSAADAAESPSALLRAFNLPINSMDVDDPELLRLTIIKERFSKIEKFGKEKGTQLLLDFRNQISPGVSAQSQKLYEELYYQLTRNAIAQSKLSEEVIRCFDDAPSRLTPELRKQFANLSMRIKAHLNALGISQKDTQRLINKFTSAKGSDFSTCFSRIFKDLLP